MNPLWRPCASIRGITSLSFSISSQCVPARLPLSISHPHQLFAFRRSLSTSTPQTPLSIILRISSGFPSKSQKIRDLPSSFLHKSPTFHSRLLATARRGPAKRQPVSNSNTTAKAVPGTHPDNVGVNPQFIPPNAISTETNRKVVGSEAWFNYYRDKSRLSDKLEPDEMSTFQRLFPSFVFLIVVLASSTYYAITYVPPANKDRLFPDMPMAVATVVGIILTNAVILFAWRVPPFWKFLNRYFIQSPGEPQALALIGNTFSHHTLWHFGANMAGLFLLGTTLCDQIGRGNFLALYMSSAALSSFGSLALNVALRRFHIYGLGASGAVFGVLGGYATLNPDSQVYFILLPIFTIKAVTVATIMGTWEFISLIFGWSMWLDHAAHLGGLLMGSGLTFWLKEEARRRREVEVRKQLRK